LAALAVLHQHAPEREVGEETGEVVDPAVALGLADDRDDLVSGELAREDALLETRRILNALELDLRDFDGHRGVLSLLERSRLHANPVLDREVDAQDRAGRSRVVGGHVALADVGLDVLVAEREVVPAGVANLVGEYRRGPIRPLA